MGVGGHKEDQQNGRKAGAVTLPRRGEAHAPLRQLTASPGPEAGQVHFLHFSRFQGHHSMPDPRSCHEAVYSPGGLVPRLASAGWLGGAWAKGSLLIKPFFHPFGASQHFELSFETHRGGAPAAVGDGP